jgi:hypothetical protein
MAKWTYQGFDDEGEVAMMSLLYFLFQQASLVIAIGDFSAFISFTSVVLFVGLSDRIPATISNSTLRRRMSFFRSVASGPTYQRRHFTGLHRQRSELEIKS